MQNIYRNRLAIIMQKISIKLVDKRRLTTKQLLERLIHMFC